MGPTGPTLGGCLRLTLWCLAFWECARPKAVLRWAMEYAAIAPCLSLFLSFHEKHGNNNNSYSGSGGKEPAHNAGDIRDAGVWSLGREDPLEEGMATHSSILAWRIPRSEEPGGLHTVHGVTELGMTEATTHHLLNICWCAWPKGKLCPHISVRGLELGTYGCLTNHCWMNTLYC